MQGKIEEHEDVEPVRGAGGAKSAGPYAIYLAIGALVVVGLVIWLIGVNAAWAVYTDEADGYSISHPRGWEVIDSMEVGVPDVVQNNEGSVIVSINTAELGGDADGVTANAIVVGIQSTYESAEIQSIDSFEVDAADDEKDSYVTTGSFTDNTGREWAFDELGIVFEDGRIYMVRVSVLPAEAQAQQGTVDRILESFDVS